MSTSISPLAPEVFPALEPITGVRIATMAAGLRYQGRPDVLLIEVADGATAAATFTRSLCPSAAVDWCRSVMASVANAGVEPRALLVNAGNANAFTGAAGSEATSQSAAAVAQALGCDPKAVFLASTGVIGEPLAVEPLRAAVNELAPALQPSDASRWAEAAAAIRTTDTFSKGATRVVNADGQQYRISGIAKGSGMIAPDMATMLSFVFTDAPIGERVLDLMTKSAVDHSYNRITVDSDTSTSDTVLVFATGGAGGDPIETRQDPRFEPIAAAMAAIHLDLAHQIIKDGEGATKFVAVTVTGAEHDDAAAIIARAIANSPLVKTALAASDANWGRIVMAVGKSGQRAERDRLSIWIGDERVAVAGQLDPTYSEARATSHLQGDHISLRADVGIGEGSATVWTCDLTHGYIDINAGYRS